jgi:hypothetical protein
MSMKKTLVISILLLVGSGLMVFGQQAQTDPDNLGTDTAQQALQEISVTRFEDPGFWRVAIPSDQGIITHRRLEGAPAGKEPIEAEEEAGIDPQDEYVLGVKTTFYRRGATTISVEPIRPLPIPGITKTLSVWVVGRNFNHDLYVRVQDPFGNRNTVYMGRLNFSGWKQMSAPIPTTLRQRDIHYQDQTGLQVIGFVIEPALEETFGSYYVYFDDLRAITDLFPEESRDPDDMLDAW